MTTLEAGSTPNQKVFRFKFAQEVTDSITEFATTHQYDDRHEYKESWEKWCSEHALLIENETARLKELGYTGDVVDKMFKSGRYYFRTKSHGKKKEVERRKYTGLSRETLRSMDTYISSVALPDKLAPAASYNEYCVRNVEVLRKEVNSLVQDLGFDSELVTDKLKKTFKNRYFQVSRKLAQE